MGAADNTPEVRLAGALSDAREQVLACLSGLEWAADPSDSRRLVRGAARVRPRAELFLDAMLSGLATGDWAPFEAGIEERTIDLLVEGVISSADLNDRALAVVNCLLPAVAALPDRAPVISALFKTMLRDGDFGELDGPVLKATSEIQTAARSALDLVDRLGEMARLESRREAVQRELCSLGDVVDAAVEPLLEGARRKGVRVELDVRQEEAMLDAAEVGIAIRNLLGNAIKYGAGGGVVLVTGRREDGDAVFTVTDRGQGIPAAELPYIFDRYYRTQSSLQGDADGSGLGLYIVKRIAELHGGEAAAVSSPDIGTSFTLRLPAEMP